MHAVHIIFAVVSAIVTVASLLYSFLPTVESFDKYPRFQASYGFFMIFIVKWASLNLRSSLKPGIAATANKIGTDPTPSTVGAKANGGFVMQGMQGHVQKDKPVDGIGLLLVAAFLGLGLAGCSAYTTASNTVTVMGQIVEIAEMDLPSLQQTGIFSATEAAAVRSYLQTAADADQIAGTCVASAHAAGDKKAAFLACFNTFSSAALSPSVLASLHVLNPAAQQKVQVWVTAVTLALNTVLAEVGAQPQAMPAIAPAPASSAELFMLQERLGL